MIDNIVKSDTEMQPTDTVRTPVPQQNITILPVGTKRVTFAGMLRLLAEGQLEAISRVVLGVVVATLFSGGYSLPA